MTEKINLFAALLAVLLCSSIITAQDTSAPAVTTPAAAPVIVPDAATPTAMPVVVPEVPAPMAAPVVVPVAVPAVVPVETAAVKSPTPVVVKKSDKSISIQPSINVYYPYGIAGSMQWVAEYDGRNLSSVETFDYGLNISILDGADSLEMSLQNIKNTILGVGEASGKLEYSSEGVLLNVSRDYLVHRLADDDKFFVTQNGAVTYIGILINDRIDHYIRRTSDEASLMLDVPNLSWLKLGISYGGEIETGNQKFVYYDRNNGPVYIASSSNIIETHKNIDRTASDISFDANAKIGEQGAANIEMTISAFREANNMVVPDTYTRLGGTTITTYYYSDFTPGPEIESQEYKGKARYDLLDNLAIDLSGVGRNKENMWSHAKSSSYNLVTGLSYRPLKDLTLTGKFNKGEVRNITTTDPAYLAYKYGTNSNANPSYVVPETPMNRDEFAGELNAKYRVLKGVTLYAGYKYDDIKRPNAENFVQTFTSTVTYQGALAPTVVLANSTNNKVAAENFANTIKAGASITPFGWLDIDVKYKNMKSNVAVTEISPDYSDDLNASVSASIVDNLQFTADYDYKREKNLSSSFSNYTNDIDNGVVGLSWSSADSKLSAGITGGIEQGSSNGDMYFGTATTTATAIALRDNAPLQYISYFGNVNGYVSITNALSLNANAGITKTNGTTKVLYMDDIVTTGDQILEVMPVNVISYSGSLTLNYEIIKDTTISVNYMYKKWDDQNLDANDGVYSVVGASLACKF